MRASIFAVLLVMFLSSGFVASSAIANEKGPKRLALIIANEDYTLPELQLDNPVNDALAINEALAALGFENKLILNSSKQSLEQQIGIFISNTRARMADGEQTVLLLYYAGHGIQFQGANYLVPVDSQLSAEPQVSGQDIKREFSSLSTITNRLATLNALTNIVILDACRDLPFSELAGDPIKGWTDLVKPNFFVAFGTAPGAKALDGTGSVNGLYTQAIIDHIHTPNQNLSQLFQNVRGQVMAASSGYQVPQETNQATYDFYFVANDKKTSVALILAVAFLVVIALIMFLKFVRKAESKVPISGILYDDSNSVVISALQDKSMVLGRGTGSQIRLDDPTNKISREHCKLTIDSLKACVYLEELASTNGTYLGNSVKPMAKKGKVKLKSGDRFYLAGPKGNSDALALRVELSVNGVSKP